MGVEASPAQSGGYGRARRAATKQEWGAAVAAFEQAHPEEPIALPIAPMQRTFTASGVESSVAAALEAADGENKHTLHLYGRSLRCCGIESVRDVLALGKEQITEIKSIGRLAIPTIAHVLAVQAPGESWHGQSDMSEIARLYADPDEIPIGLASMAHAALGLSVGQVATQTAHRLAMFAASREHYKDEQLNAVIRAQYLARDFAQKFAGAAQ
ncbi:MAG TPA: hypothetical protein VLG11_04155 [Candidatus Saccharimonadales bacterium]|nr:hypothetical protein [Candidatus Saccharimonadales bacterium]